MTCRYLPPLFEHRFRIISSHLETCQTIDSIQHPSVKAVLTYLNVHHGLEIYHGRDLPIRSGIGSSSAFTVGLLHALYCLQGQLPRKSQLAQESIYIEQTILQETVGSQDQVCAAHGGLNHIAKRLEAFQSMPSLLSTLNEFEDERRDGAVGQCPSGFIFRMGS